MSERASSRRMIFVVAGVVAVVAVVALVVAIRGPTTGADPSAEGRVIKQEIQTPDWNRAAADRPAPSDRYAPWNEQATRTRITAMLGAQSEQLGLNQAAADRLAVVAGEVLAAYWTADVDRYVTLLESQGLVPRAELRGRGRGDAMRSMTRSVREAPLDLDSIRAWVFARDGKVLQPPPQLGVSGKSLSQPRGERDITNPGNTGSDVIALAVPTHMLNMEGDPLEADLVVYFAQRPDDGEWLLVRVEIHREPDPIHMRTPDKQTPSGILPPL